MSPWWRPLEPEGEAEPPRGGRRSPLLTLNPQPGGESGRSRVWGGGLGVSPPGGQGTGAPPSPTPRPPQHTSVGLSLLGRFIQRWLRPLRSPSVQPAPSGPPRALQPQQGCAAPRTRPHSGGSEPRARGSPLQHPGEQGPRVSGGQVSSVPPLRQNGGCRSRSACAASRCARSSKVLAMSCTVFMAPRRCWGGAQATGPSGSPPGSLPRARVPAGSRRRRRLRSPSGSRCGSSTLLPRLQRGGQPQPRRALVPGSAWLQLGIPGGPCRHRAAGAAACRASCPAAAHRAPQCLPGCRRGARSAGPSPP